MTALGVLLAVLRVAGWLLLALLALILVFLLLPAVLSFDWRPTAFTVRLRVLFLNFTLYPRTEKPKTEKEKKQPPQDEHGNGENTKKEKNAGGGVTDKLKSMLGENPGEKLHQLLTHAGKAGRILLRGLHFRHIIVYWTVTGWDAAETALHYGRTMGACSAFWVMARQFLDLQADTLYLQPDYTGDERKKRHLSCQIHASPCILLAAGLYLLAKIWKDPTLHAKGGST